MFCSASDADLNRCRAQTELFTPDLSAEPLQACTSAPVVEQSGCYQGELLNIGASHLQSATFLVTTVEPCSRDASSLMRTTRQDTNAIVR